jgi:hypothetical protein
MSKNPNSTMNTEEVTAGNFVGVSQDTSVIQTFSKEPNPKEGI